jgi:hypothetical protein
MKKIIGACIAAAGLGGFLYLNRRRGGTFSLSSFRVTARGLLADARGFARDAQAKAPDLVNGVKDALHKAADQATAPMH